MSLGFIQEGFHISLANDNEDVCIETYKYNHPQIPENNIILGDIRELNKNLNKLSKDGIGVVGGPPCQGFSYVNQQRVIDDPRNKLYKYFIDAISIIEPNLL